MKDSPDYNLTTSFLTNIRFSNTGKRQGEEVVQLYIHDLDPKIDKPVRELKGFSKIALNPGEAGTVTFTIRRDLAYYDVHGRGWKADAGKYEIEIGASSRDLRLKSVIRLTGAFTEPVPGSNSLAQK